MALLLARLRAMSSPQALRTSKSAQQYASLYLHCTPVAIHDQPVSLKTTPHSVSYARGDTTSADPLTTFSAASLTLEP